MTVYKTIPDLPAASSANDTDLVEISQGGTSRRITAGQLVGLISDGVTNSVKNYGVRGDGSDETLTLQAAINASTGNHLFFPPGFYAATTLTIPGSIRMIGVGNASVIRQRAGTGNLHLFVATATSIAVIFENLTLDGQKALQTNSPGDNASLVRYACNGVVTNPACLTISNVTFRNGRIFDVWANPNGGDAAATIIDISHCRFLGGLDGTTTMGAGTILLQSTPIANVSHNYFDLLATPVGTGRSGIVMSEGTSPVGPGRFTIIGNHFRNMGRAATDALGNIDAYSNGADVIVQGNRLEQPYGRGITIKGDVTNAVVSGNMITGLNPGVYTDAAQICLFPSVTTSVGNNIVATGNVLADSGWDAISVSMVETGLVGLTKAIVVSNNAISNPVRYGINVRYASNIAIVGNSINGSQLPIHLDTVFAGTANIANNQIADPTIPGVSPVTRAGTGIYDENTNSAARTTIQGNMLVNCAGRGIQKSSTGGGIIRNNTVINSASFAISVTTTAATLVENNFLESASPGFQVPNYGSGGVFFSRNTSSLGVRVIDATVANTANVITAPFDVVYVDTATAAQIVRVINGVPDGCEVMVRLSSITNSLTLSQAGGTTNLSIGADIVLTGIDDNVVLRYFKQTNKMVLVSKRP